MGAFRIGRLIRILATLGACIVLSLNFVLLTATFGVTIPFLE